eukprot:Pgem_evm1s19958
MENYKKTLLITLLYCVLCILPAASDSVFVNENENSTTKASDGTVSLVYPFLFILCVKLYTEIFGVRGFEFLPHLNTDTTRKINSKYAQHFSDSHVRKL